MAIVRNVVEKGHVRTFCPFLLIPHNPSYSYSAPLLTRTLHPFLLVPCTPSYSYPAPLLTRTLHPFSLIPCTPSHSYPVPLLSHTLHPFLLVPQGDPVYEVTGLLTLSDILSEIRSGDSECVTAPPSVADGELSCRVIPLLI